MLAITEKIIGQQAGELAPADFVDRYEGALRELIEEKKKGHVVRKPAAANDDTKVVDLMAALRNSLKAAGGRKDRAVSTAWRRAPSAAGRRRASRPGAVGR